MHGWKAFTQRWIAGQLPKIVHIILILNFNFTYVHFHNCGWSVRSWSCLLEPFCWLDMAVGPLFRIPCLFCSFQASAISMELVNGLISANLWCYFYHINYWILVLLFDIHPAPAATFLTLIPWAYLCWGLCGSLFFSISHFCVLGYVSFSLNVFAWCFREDFDLLMADILKEIPSSLTITIKIACNVQLVTGTLCSLSQLLWHKGAI